MSEIQILSAREVPLGGVRALNVRRTIPHRDRSFVGAWCFCDHYGPTPVKAGNEGGMDVPPHPHTGLQTVSWLFEGEIEHRDTGGVIAKVRPGEMNLMSAGAGIAHSEVSTAATSILHGVQLWVVLPDADRHGERGFQHHVPEPAPLPGAAGTALVFVGSLAGVDAAPVHSFTPLLGAQLDLVPGATCVLEIDPSFEYGILLDRGELSVNGTALAYADLACLEPGERTLTLTAGPGPVRLILLGGEPFTEEIVMWWNFVGRTHDEIVAFREEWQAHGDRFGEVPGYVGTTDRIPAPQLPNVRLKTRNRRGSSYGERR
ncbi:pirin family protein [Granulicoccus phenolivorans]|uniref:pirin family protein n=1 Tax=Granulicoccus phenolivorans TaxID=266854 RepID=UPI00040303B2|nr:pirin family protein [Granulicoccus phenolivorans]